MPIIPASVDSPPLHEMNRIHQGKVRDSYLITRGADGVVLHRRYRCVEHTNRASVHDVILPWLIPGKGAVLNALDIWWRKMLEKKVKFAHDLTTYGKKIDGFIPGIHAGQPDLQSRTRIVEEIDMYPIELIVRGLLISKAWDACQAGKPICGNHLPKGLEYMSELNPPIFTPTDKGGEDGHDQPITTQMFDFFKRQNLRSLTIELFKAARDIARNRGFEILDGKLEAGQFNDMDCFGDEMFTPDASRFVLIDELNAARRKRRDPRSFDKQRLRDWITREFGLTAKTPLNTPEGIALVRRIHESPAPTELIGEISQTYLDLFRMLTGHDSPHAFLGLN